MKTLGMWMLGFCLTLGTISMVGCSGEEKKAADPPATGADAGGEEGSEAKEEAGSDAK
ncbi:MAG: hypothetical protein RH917_16095 [Lacipirellulaceae bacterium]